MIITVEATFMSLVSGIAQHEFLIPVFYLTAIIFVPIGLVLLMGMESCCAAAPPCMRRQSP